MSKYDYTWWKCDNGSIVLVIPKSINASAFNHYNGTDKLKKVPCIWIPSYHPEKIREGWCSLIDDDINPINIPIDKVQLFINYYKSHNKEVPRELLNLIAPPSFNYSGQRLFNFES